MKTSGLSGLIESKDTDQAKLDKLRRISRESSVVYNALTLEIVRLQRLLIDFGMYRIKLGTTDEETQKFNLDFFTLLRSLFVILEFDSTYPEARKILMDKREKERSERSANPTKLFSGMMGAMAKGFAVIDFLGITDEDPKKKEKKKSKSGSMESESMNMNESFLK